MENGRRRVVITGMAINTPLGDTLGAFYEGLMAGKSAIRKWTAINTDGIYSKVGGDLSHYDAKAKVEALKDDLPQDVYKRLRRLVKRAPFTTKLSMTVAADAFVDASLYGKVDPTQVAVIVGGHNLNKLYQHNNYLQFSEEPDYVDSLASLLALDTDHAGSVSEVLGLKGPIYTVGGACASANVALRNAIDEIRYHDYPVAMVVGATLEYAPMDLHAMALMGAIAFKDFNEEPARASRPYDSSREGFVPAHGSAALIVEDLEHAQARGATIYAEVLAVTAASDGNHLPNPSRDGQVRTMQRLLKRGGVKPEQIDYVSAHATSTPLGDVTEIQSIKDVFGAHAKNLKINAPKSMLGHTCWSAPAVETVAAIMQMNKGWLHPSINIESIDPDVDLDVCANEPCEHEINYFVKNSFGFGGINCCGLYKRYVA